MFNNRIYPSSNTNEPQQWDNRHFATPASTAKSNFKDPLRSFKKKVKRLRTAFTTSQLKALENSYNRCKYINAKIREELSSLLKISEKTIKVWFQNRRMKERRETQGATEEEIQQESDMNNVQKQNYTVYCTPDTTTQSYTINVETNSNVPAEPVHNYYNFNPVSQNVYPQYYAQYSNGSSYYCNNATQTHYQVHSDLNYNTQYVSYPSAPELEGEFLDVINL